MLLSQLLQRGTPCSLHLSSNLHNLRPSLLNQSSLNSRPNRSNRSSLNLRSQLHNLHLRLLLKVNPRNSLLNPRSLLHRNQHSPRRSPRSPCLSLHNLRRSLNNQAGDMYHHNRNILLVLEQV